MQAKTLAAKRLVEIGNRARESLVDNISPSVTTDIWSATGGESYLSFTLHVITDKFVPKMFSLGAVPMGSQAHTGAVIAGKL